MSYLETDKGQRMERLKRSIRPRKVITGIVIFLTFLASPNALVAESGQGDVQELRSPLQVIEEQKEEEIRDLRERIELLEEQQGSILDQVGERVTLGGYGAVFLDTFPPDSPTTFDQKLELIISGHLHDRIRFYNEIDLEVGREDERVRPEQSYIDFLMTKGFNLRAGVLQIPFGKWNIDHFDPRRDLTDRPIVARQIVPTTWSDIGASFFGLVPISNSLRATYEIAVINGFDDDFVGAAPGDGLRPARTLLSKDNNGDKAVVGRVALKWYNQYEIGLSGYRGDYDTNSKNGITGIDVDLEFKPQGRKILEDFELKGEYAYFKVEGVNTPSSLWGGYLQVNYHFWPQVLNETFLGRTFNSPTFTLVGRYGHGRINTVAGTGDLTQDRVTLGFNYRPIENYVFKMEYQINNGGIERKDLNGFLTSIAWLF